MLDFWWVAAVGLLIAAAVVLSRRGRETVYASEWALEYIDGAYTRILPPGRYGQPLWRERRIVRHSRWTQVAGGAGADVLTSDRFSARLTATALYRIVDPVAVEQNGFHQRFNLMLGQALVQLAAERTLDALLSERGQLDALLVERLAPAFPEVALEQVMVSNLTLPPEVRKLLNAAEMTRMEGLAALERARSEQAALRSLANAARMLKDNPELMRLRTLQALSPTGKGATLVLGADTVIPPNA